MRKLITTLSLLAAFGITGCKKDNHVNDQSLKPKTAAAVMRQFLIGNETSDFTVLVSSARGISLYEQSGINTATNSGIEAYAVNEHNVGVLSVNEKNIPFQGKTYFYQIDADSDALTTTYTGKMNQYQFSSTNTEAVPSFSIEKYSPAVSALNYEGILDKTINPQSDFIIIWGPDTQMPAEDNKGLIILAAEQENGLDPLISYFWVDDITGSFTVTSQMLQQFVGAGYVMVYYARGYSSLEEIDGKTIDFQFLTYSWSKIHFD